MIIVDKYADRIMEIKNRARNEICVAVNQCSNSYFWLWFPCMTHDELCSYWASLDHVLCTLPENLYEQMCKYETELKKDLEFCKNRASLNSMQSKDFYHPISPCHPSLPGNIYPIDRTNVTDNELYCSMTSSEGYYLDLRQKDEISFLSVSDRRVIFHKGFDSVQVSDNDSLDELKSRFEKHDAMRREYWRIDNTFWQRNPQTESTGRILERAKNEFWVPIEEDDGYLNYIWFPEMNTFELEAFWLSLEDISYGPKPFPGTFFVIEELKAHDLDALWDLYYSHFDNGFYRGFTAGNTYSYLVASDGKPIFHKGHDCPEEKEHIIRKYLGRKGSI